MASPFKQDPSRTGLLRRSAVAEMKRRFAAVKKALTGLVVRDDVFGAKIGTERLQFNVQPGEWAFRTDPKKVEAFRDWLQEQVDAEILTTDSQGRPWLAQYIESAHKKGVQRTYKDAYGDLVETPTGTALLAGDGPLGVSFAGAARTATVERIYSRAYNDLKGVTDAMAQKLSRVLAQGLADGKNPIPIARALRKEIDTLTRTRANTIARTEIIAAQAEGQLDAFQELNVTEVTLMAEWLTAGDDRVCELCAELDGVVLSVDEARNLLPRHPNCRCAWAPVTRRSSGFRPSESKKALDASVQAERPQLPLKKAREKSTWPGRSVAPTEPE